MADITITAEPPKPITVDLAGKTHTVRPIKASLGIALAQRFQGKNAENLEVLQKNLNELIRIMFGPKDAKVIQKRLDDPEDLLDMPHLFDLMNKLTELASGNPTT